MDKMAANLVSSIGDDVSIFCRPKPRFTAVLVSAGEADVDLKKERTMGFEFDGNPN
jgi:hypothetical protein